MGKTLFEKVWDNHVVDSIPNGPSIIYIDKHLNAGNYIGFTFVVNYDPEVDGSDRSKNNYSKHITK